MSSTDVIDVRSATITEKGQISIPKGIREDGFKEGSKVAIISYKDRIEIRPIKFLNKNLSTAYASEKILAKDWDTKEEDEAWKNL